MTDLAHTYTSDITYQEVLVYAADTEFNAQREGQNTNFLLDAYGPIVSQITSISLTAAKIRTFTASGTFGTGNNIIYTSPDPMFFALLYVTPLDSSLYISQSGGGFTSMPVQGPPVPIYVDRENPGFFRNTIFNFTGGGNLQFGIVSPGFTQLVLHINGGGANFTIKGVSFHG